MTHPTTVSLEAVTVPGFRSWIVVRNNGVVIGAISHRARNTASERHPWQAWVVTSTNDEPKLQGSFYRGWSREGAKQAALNAVVYAHMDRHGVCGCPRCGRLVDRDAGCLECASDQRDLERRQLFNR